MSHVITSKFNYVFFDMDGTLVETDYANFLAYKKAIKTVLKVEMNLDFGSFRRFNAELLQEYFPSLTKKEISSVVQLKKQFFSEFLPETLLIPETCERLRECKEDKHTILVTNAHSMRAQQVMKFHGLDRFISMGICSNHRLGIKNKYQHAIEILKAEPHLVRVFENEKVEFENAIQSGIKAKNIVMV